MPSLDEQTLDDWWKYAQQVSAELVKPDENHDFSLLSVILAAGETDKSVLKKLKKLSDERKYQSGQARLVVHPVWRSWILIRTRCTPTAGH